jgi:hypothetical protein
MIIGYARVSTTEQNLGLRHDDEWTAFDASVDHTEADYSDLKVLILVNGVRGLNAGVPARCQMSRSQMRFGSNSIMCDPRVG